MGERGEGLAEGLAEGLTEGLAEGLVEGLAEGLAEGLVEGLSEGLAEAMEFFKHKINKHPKNNLTSLIYPNPKTQTNTQQTSSPKSFSVKNIHKTI